jgi:hypothetical protein
MKYELPENVGRDWNLHKAEDFTPTARQQLVMDAAAKAIDSGLFYTTDVRAFCVKALEPSNEALQSNRNNVEGGDFGYDVYYARHAVEEQRKWAKTLDIAKALGLTVGDKLGTLVFSDFKRTTGVTITKVGRLSADITGKRGAYTVTGTIDVLTLRNAIDRAKEYGKRKDGYEDFILTRQPILETA